MKRQTATSSRTRGTKTTRTSLTRTLRSSLVGARVVVRLLLDFSISPATMDGTASTTASAQLAPHFN